MANNQGIIAPFLFFSLIGMMCFLCFLLLRSLFKDIYMIKAHSQSKDDLEEAIQIGLDAVTFQRFLKLGMILFSLESILGLCFLAPVNYYSSIPSFVNSTGILYEDVLIDALSVNNVPNRSPYLWVHLTFTWIFSICTLGAIIAFYRKSVELKLKYETVIAKGALIILTCI
jgi:hypothetical protein